MTLPRHRRKQRIVAQAELAGKTDVEQARDKAAKELAARRAEAQAEADKEAQEIYQKAENKKSCASCQGRKPLCGCG